MIETPIYYKELQKCCSNVTDTEIISAYDSIACILQLSYIARKEGLLALEESISFIPEHTLYTVPIKRLVSMVVDGTDPDIVLNIGLNKYFADNLNGIEGLCYLICLQGILNIQAGINPFINLQNLISMLPSKFESAFAMEYLEADKNDYYYSKLKKEKYPIRVNDKPIYTTEEKEQNCVEQVCSTNPTLSPKMNGYYLIKITDYVLQQLDNNSIQILLKNIENADLELVMKGLCKETKKKIFDNMSDRLASMIATDILFMGKVYSKSVVESTHKLFRNCMILFESGELILPDASLINELYDIFKTDYDTNSEKDLNCNELESLVQTYKENNSFLL